MRVLIVDDHPLFSEGLSLLLMQRYPQLLCRHASTLTAALALVKDESFDLILTDLNLPDSVGLDTLLALRQAAPQMPCTVISSDDRATTVMAAIDAGAAAYVPKTSNYNEMVGALSRIFSGGVFLPERTLQEIHLNTAPPQQHSDCALSALTARQREVLRLLMQGKPNKLICRELNLSAATVKTHLAAIFRTLDVSSRTEAVVVAAKATLVP